MPFEIGFRFDCRNLFQPVCYTYFDGDQPLYVGYSKLGLSRVFTADAKTQPDKANALKIATSVATEIYTIRDDGHPDDAYCREAELIHAYHPIFNRLCRVCGASTHHLAKLGYIWGRSDAEREAFHIRQHVEKQSTIGREYCKYCEARTF